MSTSKNKKIKGGDFLLKKLKEKRVSKGLSTLDVAKYLNEKLSGETKRIVDYRNVWSVENGERNVPVLWLEPLSELFECSIDDLVK